MKKEIAVETFTTRQKFLTSGGIILLLLPVISQLTDPLFTVVNYVTRITESSLVFKMLHQEQEGAFIYVYMFNVTNADTFLSGEDKKLKVQEVGPFTYQHDNIQLNTKEGILKFTPRMRAQFVPEESIADPRSVNLTLPNVASLAITSGASAYPYFTRLAFDILTRRLRTQSIINTDVYSFLWGYPEPLVSLAHTVMPGYIYFNEIGIMDQAYKQPLVLLEMGSTNADKFAIKSNNGISGIEARGYSVPNKRTRCNTFVDTYEGFAYPPGLTPETPIRIYRDVFCRMLDLEFIDTKTMEYGSEAFRYTLKNKTYAVGPDNECLCSSNGCIDGVTEITSCFYNLRAALSNGHFLHANPKVYERIEGIHPDVEKHGSEFIIDPKVGMALETKFTVQLNIVMGNFSTNPMFKPFADMVVPIAYVEVVQPELKESVKTSFRIVYLYVPYLLLTLEVLSAVTGVAICLYVARHILKKYLSPKRSIYFQVTQNEKDSHFGDLNIALMEKRLKTYEDNVEIRN